MLIEPHQLDVRLTGVAVTVDQTDAAHFFQRRIDIRFALFAPGNDQRLDSSRRTGNHAIVVGMRNQPGEQQGGKIAEGVGFVGNRD